jgi:hypothetical protein
VNYNGTSAPITKHDDSIIITMKISIFIAIFQVSIALFQHAGSITTSAENVSFHHGHDPLDGPEMNRVLKKKRKTSKASKAPKAASGKGKGSATVSPSSQPTNVPSASPSDVPSAPTPE